MEVVKVNKRVKVPDQSVEPLTALFRDVKAATDRLQLYLDGLAVGMGLLREGIVSFDDTTGEFLLDEADPDIMRSIPDQAE